MLVLVLEEEHWFGDRMEEDNQEIVVGSRLVVCQVSWCWCWCCWSWCWFDLVVEVVRFEFAFVRFGFEDRERCWREWCSCQ